MDGENLIFQYRLRKFHQLNREPWHKDGPWKSPMLGRNGQALVQSLVGLAWEELGLSSDAAVDPEGAAAETVS